jgi:hypothetical protein
MRNRCYVSVNPINSRTVGATERETGFSSDQCLVNVAYLQDDESGEEPDKCQDGDSTSETKRLSMQLAELILRSPVLVYRDRTELS